MVQDLKDFLAKIEADKALQEKMTGIIKNSTPENVFANCNAVAAELGYTIKQEDLQTFADEYKTELSDNDLDKVAGGSMLLAFGTVAASVGLSALYGATNYVGKKRSERNK